MAIACPDCQSTDIGVDEAPGVHDFLVETLKTADGMVVDTGRHSEAVDYLLERAEEAYAMLNRPHNKVVCGNCGWLGETDDLTSVD